MGEKSARLFRQERTNEQYSWNIVELESFRQLRQKVNELIELCNNPTCTTNEMRLLLRLNLSHLVMHLPHNWYVRCAATMQGDARILSGC